MPGAGNLSKLWSGSGTRDDLTKPSDGPDSSSEPWSPKEEPWLTDVALHLWVDVEHNPTFFRLAGTLSEATGHHLVPVMEELIGQGFRDFEFDLHALHIADSGAARLLLEVEGLVWRNGGHFSRLEDSEGFGSNVQPLPVASGWSLSHRRSGQGTRCTGREAKMACDRTRFSVSGETGS